MNISYTTNMGDDFGTPKLTSLTVSLTYEECIR